MGWMMLTHWRKIGVFVFLVAVVTLSSCFWRSDKSDEVAVPAGATAVGIPKRMYGEPVICQVSGEVFSISRESRSAIYHGRQFYFRDADALKSFLNTPEEFLPDG